MLPDTCIFDILCYSALPKVAILCKKMSALGKNSTLLYDSDKYVICIDTWEPVKFFPL